MEVRVRLWHADALVAEERGGLLWTMAYTVEALRATLEDAGFAEISVEGVCTGRARDTR